MKKIISLFIVIILFTFSCKENEPTAPVEEVPDQQLVEEIETLIINSQEANYTLLENLFTKIDSASAIDSVLKVFQADTNVYLAVSGTQGIAVEYKNGLRGGLFINSEDLEDGTGLSNGNSIIQQNNIEKLSVLDVIPKSKKTIFINPHYFERKKYADLLIASYNDWFPVAGYNKPVVYKNEQATLNVFENLSGYGIVHIYSHGWAWPSEKNIQEVYLKTGEANTISQNVKYLTELITKDIIISTSKNGSKYYISPNFIASKNNLETDTTLIYGGFCFSFLGSWPTKMINDEKAGGYFGFDWSVYTNKSTDWAMDIFAEMTDTLKNKSTTVEDWLNGPYPKEYFDIYDKKNVHIKHNGYKNLVLFEKKNTWNWPYLVIVLRNIGVQRETYSVYYNRYDTTSYDHDFYSQPYEMIKEGNILSGTKDQLYDWGVNGITHEIGNISAIIDETNMDILSFTIDHKLISNDSKDTSRTKAEGFDIPFYWQSESSLQQYENKNAMSHLTKFDYKASRGESTHETKWRILKLVPNDYAEIEFSWSSTP